MYIVKYSLTRCYFCVGGSKSLLKICSISSVTFLFSLILASCLRVYAVLGNCSDSSTRVR